MGHEFSGTVIELGEGVVGPHLGDNVVVEPYFVCDECPPCKAGSYHLCQKMGFIGLAGGGGGLSERVVVDQRWVHPIGDRRRRGRRLRVRRGGRRARHPARRRPARRGAGQHLHLGSPRDRQPQKPVLKEIDLRGTIAYVRDHRETIAMVQEGGLDLLPFITGRIALEDLVTEGFDTLIHHNDTAVKILVHP